MFATRMFVLFGLKAARTGHISSGVDSESIWDDLQTQSSSLLTVESWIVTYDDR